MSTVPRLAITCGDPAGIGPEVIAHWLGTPEAAEGEHTLFGPESWLSGLALPRGVRPVAVGAAGFRATPGAPTPTGAEAALEAMEAAAAGCREGRFDAVVTGPVSKIHLERVGFAHPGQSEFFAARWGGEPTMAFAGGRLRVALATWHIPLAEVTRHLTREALGRTVAHALWLARAEGVAAPRVAVCGLNPHAGEEGMLGDDERERLDPWLRALEPELGPLGVCLPADTVFARALRGEFDVVVALYHDQGLAPLKAVDFDVAVNITLGLAHLRTSPDHGTAFGIAGAGRADPGSFANAVRLARRLAAHAAIHPFTG